MKDIVEFLDMNESKSAENRKKEVKEYISSWLKRNTSDWRSACLVVIEGLMDYFKNEMEYEEGARRGIESSQYKESTELYIKARDAYQSF